VLIWDFPVEQAPNYFTSRHASVDRPAVTKPKIGLCCDRRRQMLNRRRSGCNGIGPWYT